MNSLSRPAAVQVSSNFVRKLFLQRFLISNLVIRDLKSRYVGSFMDFFWSVIHPLVLLVCYTFVFSIVFDIRPLSANTDNFAIFLFCGILPWLFFQDTVSRSCTCVVENGNLIRKTVFPSEILPVSILFSNLVNHLVGLAILMTVLLFMGLLSWTAVTLPLFLFLLMLFCLGMGWLLAALQVFLRDTFQVLTVLLVFWFWFTPIFYSVELVPDALRPFIELNPLASVVGGYRSALLEHQWPSLKLLINLLLWSGGTFFLGGLVFRNTKREFLDVL